MEDVWYNNVLTPEVDITLFGKHCSQLLFCQPRINDESKRRLNIISINHITILYLCITSLLASRHPQKGYFGISADTMTTDCFTRCEKLIVLTYESGIFDHTKGVNWHNFRVLQLAKFRIFSFELLTNLTATLSFLSIYLLQNLQVIKVWFNARNAEISVHFSGFNWFQNTKRFWLSFLLAVQHVCKSLLGQG